SGVRPVVVLSKIEEPAAPEDDLTEHWESPCDTTPAEEGALPDLANGLPLKDSMNNLNVPLRKRLSDADWALAETKGIVHLATPSDASYGMDSVGRSDFQNAYPVLPLMKSQHCHGPLRRVFSCQQCAKAYTSLGALKMHIRTHTLPCACGICGKAFSRPWLLQGHIRTHTGEKPFSCFHCGRGFADRSNLRAHLQTHSEVKRYICPGCSKSFSRISLLSKHRDGCCCPLS
uniref:Snail family transcriptional repressor 3 n=1 Tax=Leptobrachium leishanense TaxID=445787 RepID=A0A8C5PE20_9ANUR